MDFKLDSGADTNIISTKLLNKIDKNVVIESTPLILEAYGGPHIQPIGTCMLVCISDLVNRWSVCIKTR